MRYVVFCFLLLFASAAHAITITVPTDHSTIQAAVNAATGADTVVVNDGTYTEQVTIPTGKNGLTIQAANQHGAVVDGELARNHGFTITVDDNIDNITIDGFLFRDHQQSAIYVRSTTASGWTITNNKIVNSFQYGIHLERHSGTSTISDNEIEFTQRHDESFGIYALRMENVQITGNQIFFTGKNAIRARLCHDGLIENNILHHSSTGITLHRHDGGMIVRNNLIYETRTGLIVKHHNEGAQAQDDLLIRHNTLYSLFGVGFLMANNGGDLSDYADYRNNVVALSGRTLWYENPNTYVGTTNVTVDYNMYYNPGGGQRVIFLRDAAGNPSCTTVACIDTIVSGWENNGFDDDPEVNATATLGGELSYAVGSPTEAGGQDLGAPLNTQMGALNTLGNLVQTTREIRRHVFTSCTPGCDNSIDENHFTNYDFDENDQLVYDMGSIKSVAWMGILTGFEGVTNPRNFTLEISDDNISYTTILNETNTPQHDSFWFEFDTVTGRYLRFTVTANQGTGTAVRIEELLAGSVTPKTAGSITVIITASDNTATEEGTTTGTFKLERQGGSSGALVVECSYGGTAAGGRYTTSDSCPITIADGSTMKTVTITPVDNETIEPSIETITLTVDPDIPVGTDYDVGSPSVATINLVDNDSVAVVLSGGAYSGGSLNR